jgi:DNA polymerase-1
MSAPPGGGAKRTWLLVDGHNLAFRCFYGIPAMATADGIQTNATYGWVRSLWKLEDLVRPDGVCVFFDCGGSDARKNILSEYKANRKPMPEELRQQLNYINLLAIAHGYHIVMKEGLEADDLLAAFANVARKNGEISYIASGDKDFAQCVCESVFQILPPSAGDKGMWKILDRDGVREKFGVYPEQIVDYLCLLGDSADNISGVDGIGAKRANRLLNQFGTIENMLENRHLISSPRIRTSLADSLDRISRNRQLISLQSDMEFPLPEAKIHRSTDDIVALLEKLQLKSLVTAATKRFQEQGDFFDKL